LFGSLAADCVHSLQPFIDCFCSPSWTKITRCTSFVYRFIPVVQRIKLQDLATLNARELLLTWTLISLRYFLLIVFAFLSSIYLLIEK